MRPTKNPNALTLPALPSNESASGMARVPVPVPAPEKVKRRKGGVGKTTGVSGCGKVEILKKNVKT